MERMGRGSVRVAKRAREAGEEFEEMRSREVESKVMAERPDEQLFFVDRGQRWGHGQASMHAGRQSGNAASADTATPAYMA